MRVLVSSQNKSVDQTQVFLTSLVQNLIFFHLLHNESAEAAKQMSGERHSKESQGGGCGEGTKANAEQKERQQTQSRTQAGHNRGPRATLMFSVKHRQMEELNSGQSFGRAGNDLNLLAQPETVRLYLRKASPGIRRGSSPGVPAGGESEVRAEKTGTECSEQAEGEGRQLVGPQKEGRGEAGKKAGTSESRNHPVFLPILQGCRLFASTWVDFLFMAALVAPSSTGP